MSFSILALWLLILGSPPEQGSPAPVLQHSFGRDEVAVRYDAGRVVLKLGDPPEHDPALDQRNLEKSGSRFAAPVARYFGWQLCRYSDQGLGPVSVALAWGC